MRSAIDRATSCAGYTRRGPRRCAASSHRGPPTSRRARAARVLPLAPPGGAGRLHLPTSTPRAATRGIVRFDDEVDGHSTTAHPHLDPATREMVNLVVHAARRHHYRVFSLGEGFDTRRLIADVPVGRPATSRSRSASSCSWRSPCGRPAQAAAARLLRDGHDGVGPAAGHHFRGHRPSAAPFPHPPHGEHVRARRRRGARPRRVGGPEPGVGAAARAAARSRAARPRGWSSPASTTAATPGPTPSSSPRRAATGSTAW